MALKEAAEVQVLRLGDADGSVRTNAAKTLGRMGAAVAPFAAEPLACLLGDAEAPVRMQVARALGKMGEAAAAQAMEPLTRCLDDPEAVVRAAAVGALGWMTDSMGQRTVEALALRFRDNDARVRVATAGAFGRMGDAAASDMAEVLALCLNDADQSVQVAAAGALARHRRSAIEALVGRLESSDVQVRRQAAKALGCLGDMVAPLATEALVRCLADGSAGVRVEAANSLRLIGREQTANAEDSLKLTLPVEAMIWSTEDKVEVRPVAGLRAPPSKKVEEEVPGSDSCRRKRTLSWAGGVEDNRVEGRAHGRLPTLLGTPTPKTGDKPDFCLPPAGGYGGADDKFSSAAAMARQRILERLA